jgi:hypothetical protein
VRARLVVPVGLVAVGLVFAAAWLFTWPLQKAMALAPVIVVVVGAAAGLVVLWARVLTDSLRRSAHPRRIVAIAVGLVVAIAALSALGVELPRE